MPGSQKSQEQAVTEWLLQMHDAGAELRVIQRTSALYWPANREAAANRPGRRQRTSSDRPHHQRRFRYSDFGVATEVATVTLLDEQDREGNAKFGSWLSTRRVEPP